MKNYLTISFLIYVIQVFPNNFEFSRKEEGILLTWKEQNCYFYQTKMKSLDSTYARANYIHPLFNQLGDTLTEDFAPDHPHQRGIFWSWHQLMVNGEKIADPWDCKDISWQINNVKTFVKNREAVLHADVFWKITSNGPFKNKHVLMEKVEIIFRKCRSHNEMEFNIQLHAMADNLCISGSQDSKGYGGFSTRFNFPDDLKIFNSEAELEPQNYPVSAGGWVEFNGLFSNSHAKETSIVIMCQPEKLPSFNGWIIRKRESIQNPAFPGVKSLSIERDSPLSFSNKINVYNRKPKVKQIEKHYRKFCNEAPRSKLTGYLYRIFF